MNVILDHEQFEGAKALAEIGTKIAEGRAALDQLESSKAEFLDERAQETTRRVKKVLEQSIELLAEIDKNHTELVGYRTQVDWFLTDVRYLIQAVKSWKEAFDAENAHILAEIEEKYGKNQKVLEEIKGQRALLAGESSDIVRKRKTLAEETNRINDEFRALEVTKKELLGKN